MKGTRKKGLAPSLIAAGVCCLAYAAVFPLYRLWDYAVCLVVMLLAGRLIYVMGNGVDTSVKPPEPVKTGDTLADEMIARGQEMLSRIRTENDRIPDPELSRDIDSLEDVASRIFKVVAEQPQKAPQIKRFMDYYLPTTLKMLESYRRLDEQKVTGENADQSRARIHSAMNIVLDAFKKQLDTLFQNDMLDVSTDIDVLETMLKQDGLIDSGLNQPTQKEETNA